MSSQAAPYLTLTFQNAFKEIHSAVMREFRNRHPGFLVAVRAGSNHTIHTEILAGRLDGAVAFLPKRSEGNRSLISELPLHWLAQGTFPEIAEDECLRLVLFNHHCLFRTTAIANLEGAGTRWRAALTTPSLGAVWARLRSHFSILVRVGHAVPPDIAVVDHGVNHLSSRRLSFPF